MKKVYYITLTIAVLIMFISCGQTEVVSGNVEENIDVQSTIESEQTSGFHYNLDKQITIGDSVTIMVPSSWAHTEGSTQQYFYYSDNRSEGMLGITFSDNIASITSNSSKEELENAYRGWFEGLENGGMLIDEIETKSINNSEIRYFTASQKAGEANYFVFGTIVITNNDVSLVTFHIEENNYTEQHDSLIIDIIDTMVIEVAEESEPEPIIYTGTGDSVISIENIDPLSVYYIQGNSSSSHFAVKGYDDANNSTALFVNTTSPYSGITFDPSGTTTMFEISAVGDWTIEVRSLLACETIFTGEPFVGNGDNIILISGSPGLAEIIGNAASSHFAVKSYGNSSDLLVNTTDPYSGTVKINDSPILLEITAEGEWSITMQ